MSNKAVTIRDAIETDLGVLVALAVDTWVKAFGDSMSQEEIDEHVSQYLSKDAMRCYVTEDVVIVAETGSHIVGYAHLSAIAYDVDTADAISKSLQRVYVDAGYQGQGIGRALIQAALSHPFVANARYIYLDVWEKNLGAIRLYERMGFKRVSELRFYHADGTVGDLDYIMQYDRERFS